MAEQASSGSGFHTAVEIWSRRKWLAVTVFLTVLVVAVGVVAGLPNIYRATARVLVDRERVPEAFVRSAVTGEIETRLQSISQEVLGRARLEALLHTRAGLEIGVASTKAFTAQLAVVTLPCARPGRRAETLKTDAIRCVIVV